MTALSKSHVAVLAVVTVQAAMTGSSTENSKLTPPPSEEAFRRKDELTEFAIRRQYHARARRRTGDSTAAALSSLTVQLAGAPALAKAQPRADAPARPLGLLREFRLEILRMLQVHRDFRANLREIRS